MLLKLSELNLELPRPQTACLVVSPITVGNFAFLFNCTPVGRTSDSMTVPSYRDGLAVVRPTEVYMYLFSGIQFHLLLSPYLLYIS